jgi:hypothetical protein
MKRTTGFAENGISPKASVGGRPPHVQDARSRKLVEIMVAIGTNHDEIARTIGISVGTLDRKYRNELNGASAKTNAAIGNSLFLQAVGGPKHDWRKANPQVGMFWAKTRMRWRDREPDDGQLVDNDPQVIRVSIVGNPEHTRQIAKEAEEAARRRRPDDHE